MLRTLVVMAALTPLASAQLDFVDKLIPTDAGQWGQVGTDIAVDGATMVVGAEWDGEVAAAGGAAYVYQKQGGSWSEVVKLVPPGIGQGNYVGGSVDILGDVIVLGARGHAYGGVAAGAVFIFERDGNGQWVFDRRLQADDLAPTSQFGADVALVGDTLVVGAMSDDQGAPDGGAVYVFERQGDDWVQVDKLVPDDLLDHDFFGRKVAFDGETIVASSRFTAGYLGHGKAYVYALVDGEWTFQQDIERSDGFPNDKFADAIDVLGDVIVIGAPTSGTGLLQATSAAIVYERDQNGLWSRTKTFSAMYQLGYFLGAGLDIEPGKLLLGASGDPTRETKGIVFSYERDAEGVWQLDDFATPPGPWTHWDKYAEVVELENGEAFVGRLLRRRGRRPGRLGLRLQRRLPRRCQRRRLPRHHRLRRLPAALRRGRRGGRLQRRRRPQRPGLRLLPGALPGRLRFVKPTGAGPKGPPPACPGGTHAFHPAPCHVASLCSPPTPQCTPSLCPENIMLRSLVAVLGVTPLAAAQLDFVDKLIPAQAGPGDQVGTDIAVDGDVMVIGAEWDDEADAAAGAAYVYERIEGVWQEVDKLVPPGIGQNSYAGGAVDVWGDTIAIGARGFSGYGNSAGAVFVYDRDEQGEWLFRQKLEAAQFDAMAQFGADVALVGDTLVIGAASDSESAVFGGAVYVFERDQLTWTPVGQVLPPTTCRTSTSSVPTSPSTARPSSRRATSTPATSRTARPTSTPWRTARASSSRTSRRDDGFPGDMFAASLDVLGDVMVIGAPTGGAGLLEATSTAIVYERDELGQWERTKSFDVMYDLGYFMGASVDVEPGRLLLGAAGDPTRQSKGIIFQYERDAEGAWQLDGFATPAGAWTHWDKFAENVVLDGAQAFASASYDNEGGQQVGSVYVYSAACAADVNADGSLDILDFVAFQQLFAGGDMAADCNTDAILNVLDFVCYQALFQAGCGS